MHEKSKWKTIEFYQLLSNNLHSNFILMKIFIPLGIILLFAAVFSNTPVGFAKSEHKLHPDNIDKAAVLVRNCNAKQVRHYAGPGILSLKYQIWEKKRNIRGFIMEIDLRKTNFDTVIRKLADKSCI